jgi:hypothetical protein
MSLDLDGVVLKFGNECHLSGCGYNGNNNAVHGFLAAMMQEISGAISPAQHAAEAQAQAVGNAMQSLGVSTGR